MALSPLLRPVSFDDLPGWRSDPMADAFAAFRRSADRSRIKPYRSGALGIEAEAFDAAFEAALAHPALDDAGARAFFEAWFSPCLILPEDRPGGFVTGFYEPVVDASPIRTARHRFALLARPADLVDVDDDNRPAGMDSYLAFGRATDDGIVEYFDRAAIEEGALAGRGLEIAWLEDPVDVFFIHVQGAARLRMPGGSRRVTYAAKSGQRFTGPGHVLADMGEIPKERVTMQSIRAWFRAHPNRVDEILRRNRSFIFFRDAPVDDESLGPVAAAKVPLTPGRSLAVDRLLHTFGTPFFVHAERLDAFGTAPFARLMVAQDTGSAIVGPARGDLFAGSGDAAGEIAGVVKHDADFFALVPRRALDDRP
ncbi:transglycosylase [Aquibium carbonis]|uniref:peptidoglycan lytic exotransglycosylase n=1 Tax=Aquibium carbonis TaxID=2495581 RepID=A0A429Z361_9HYPH|nr:murein transglycosylase A [Aquibium carbonis]RST88129.1 transglycosylase [Aquibium carbonis]